MTDHGGEEKLELHVTPAEKKGSELAEDLILTPSPADEQPENLDLTLETETIAKVGDITFDGKAESESRIEKAMKAYDAAMDDAAGIEKG